MIRPIKFRGRSIDTGEFVFAELGQISVVKDDPNLLLFLIEKPVLVYNDSVTCLVGFDTDNNEVYEDDTLVDQNGRVYTIADDVRVELFCGGVYESLYSDRYKFKLKQNTR